MHKYFFAGLFFILAAIGCSPALHPLYRDFKHNHSNSPPLRQIELALMEAGWELTDSPSPNAVSTVEREIRNWFLYKVVVQVEVVPVGSQHVRLFVHPYRVYVTGFRSKIPFLKPGIRRRIVHDIDRAFESHNLIEIGTDMSRDRIRTR
ncbi:MAG: hypothetical protein OXE92_04125 [Bacteroidetes bacterium]|nr:hypothetical protein [Bacteroidota bacterium]MCY4204896.1 hypothetical protein [Bacteroidota bacterium]